MEEQAKRNQAFHPVLERLSKLGWYHTISLPDGQVIPGLQTEEHLRWRLSQFDIASDLTGKRVLDVGAWDGWFTFECERRGASVTAIDANLGTNFLIAKNLKRSDADYRIVSVMDLTVESHGVFDIVLFFGVLYHLKHPLLALEKVCGMSTDRVLVESYVSDDDPGNPSPRMEFYEFGELCGQFDNWNGPNVACLLAWCRTAGFARVVLHSVVENRAHVTCYRKWPAFTPVTDGAAPPYIVLVQNTTLNNHSFSMKRDDYVSVWFEYDGSGLSLDDVYPEVSSFGVRPVAVVFSGGAWLVNFKLPFGLKPGWAALSIRVKESDWSNVLWIGIEGPAEAAGSDAEISDRLAIVAAFDNNTWERGRVHLGLNSCIAMWVTGLESSDVTRGNIEIRLSGTSVPCVFLSEADKEGQRQINLLLPSGLSAGVANVQVAYGNQRAVTVQIELV